MLMVCKYYFLVFFYYCFIFINFIETKPAWSPKNFPQRHTDIGNVSRFTRSAINLGNFISHYQRRYSLNVTGQLNNETVAHMSRVPPHCGNVDSSTLNSANASKFLSEDISPRLKKRNLTWKISAYPFHYDNHTTVFNVNAAATKAFSLWSSVCNLNFYQTDSETPDIEMKFLSAKRHHTLTNNRSCGRFEPGEYAHYVEGSNAPGVIHFNDNKYFKSIMVDNYDGYINLSVNLVYLMAHEIGHVLNFAHTNEKGSIMFRKFYKLDILAVKLTKSDVAVAELRYGPKTCNGPTQQWTEFEGISVQYEGSDKQLTCAELYELKNCGGIKRALPQFSTFSTPFPAFYFAPRERIPITNWEYIGSPYLIETKSLKVADGCRLTGTYTPQYRTRKIDWEAIVHMLNTSEGDAFNYNGDFAMNCYCHSCDRLSFPIIQPMQNVCAVVFTHRNCGGAALFIPSTILDQQNFAVMKNSIYETTWDKVDILSSAANPHCTLTLCPTGSVGIDCDTVYGGDKGYSVKGFPRGYRYRSVHCSCTPPLTYTDADTNCLGPFEHFVRENNDRHLVCAELYENRHCGGNKLLFPQDYGQDKRRYFDTWRKVGSIRLAPNCELLVRYRLGLTTKKFRADSNGLTLSQLDNLNYHSMSCSCSCNFSLPIVHPSKDVCALLFVSNSCSGPVFVVPQGSTLLNNKPVMSDIRWTWARVKILSAAVNPYCSLNLCLTDDVDQECKTVKGGRHGNKVISQPFGYRRSAHCNCSLVDD